MINKSPSSRVFGRFFFPLVCSCLFAVSCNTDNKIPTENSKSATTAKDALSNGITIVDSKISTTYDAGKDETNLQINTKGTTEQFPIQGKVSKHLIADIDRNGDQEIYIQSVTKFGKSELGAFAIGKNGPIEIYRSDIGGSPVKADIRYRVTEDQLIENTKMMAPNGKAVVKELRYNLVAGEAGYSLKPEGYTTNQLRDLTGAYLLKNGKKGNTYKVLNVSKTENGEWLVSINIRKSKNTEALCTFEAIGSFIDKNLLVPMAYADNKYKSTLKITFTELMATVYTQDPTDAKEMAAFCDNKHAISGNFRKTEL